MTITLPQFSEYQDYPVFYDTDSVDLISLFCSVQIVLLGVGNHSLLKVEGKNGLVELLVMLIS